MPSTPLDQAFTTWVDDPGSPSDPGAGDLNRIQNSQVWLANPPSACLSQTVTLLYTSGFGFTTLLWNNILWNNTPGMIAGSTSLSHNTDRILFVYPGKYRCRSKVRSLYNNTAGVAQLQLIYTDSGGDEVMDGDQGFPAAAGPLFLSAEQDIIIDAGHIANGASIRGQYVQSSGGDASITNSAVAAYPRISATWIGTGL